MSRPQRRRSVWVALLLALAGVLAAGAWAVGAWVADTGSASDFGAAPQASALSEPASRAVSPYRSVAESSSAESATGNKGAPSTAASSVPVSLSIARLKVVAAIDAVGVTNVGQVEVPADPERVGWYRFSPAPGEQAGSSVIVGHVDSRGRGMGVLVALNDVRRGDVVRVSRSAGRAVDYRVVSRQTVAKDGLGAVGAFRVDGPAVLTLITCTGPYDAGEGYRNNLVVTAELVSR